MIANIVGAACPLIYLAAIVGVLVLIRRNGRSKP